MKLNVHVLGKHVAVLEQIGDFKSVMAYLPDVAPENLVSLTMLFERSLIRGTMSLILSFA